MLGMRQIDAIKNFKDGSVLAMNIYFFGSLLSIYGSNCKGPPKKIKIRERVRRLGNFFFDVSGMIATVPSIPYIVTGMGLKKSLTPSSLYPSTFRG